MKPEHQEQMRETTREAAISLIEDLAHIRDVLGKPTFDRGEVRRIAAIARRMLLDGDLGMIAAPRIGRLMLVSPDNHPYYVDGRSNEYLFFCSAGVTVLGMTFWAIAQRRLNRPLKDANPERTVELRIDNFIAQRVLCLKNRWFTRKDAIRHIAHHASGVHSSTPEPDDDLLVRLRIYAAFGIAEGKTGVSFYEAALLPKPPRFTPEPGTIDCVLMEVLGAAMLIAQSPDIAKLEAAIREECGL